MNHLVDEIERETGTPGRPPLRVVPALAPEPVEIPPLTTTSTPAPATAEAEPAAERTVPDALAIERAAVSLSGTAGGPPRPPLRTAASAEEGAGEGPVRIGPHGRGRDGVDGVHQDGDVEGRGGGAGEVGEGDEDAGTAEEEELGDCRRFGIGHDREGVGDDGDVHDWPRSEESSLGLN